MLMWHRAAVADRSRRDAVLSSRPEWESDAARPRRSVSADQEPRAARARRPARQHRRDHGARARAGGPRDDRRLDSRELADGCRARSRRGPGTGGVRALSRRARGGAAAVSSRRHDVSAEYTYDYAIVRVVPRVERGERINVGVILSCADVRVPRRPDRARHGEAARAGSGARSRGDPGRARRHSRGLRRRRRRRPDRRAAAARPLSLARVAAQHRHPDVARPHRTHQRSQGRPGATARHGRQARRRQAWAFLMFPGLGSGWRIHTRARPIEQENRRSGGVESSRTLVSVLRTHSSAGRRGRRPALVGQPRLRMQAVVYTVTACILTLA